MLALRLAVSMTICVFVCLFLFFYHPVACSKEVVQTFRMFRSSGQIVHESLKANKVTEGEAQLCNKLLVIESSSRHHCHTLQQPG